MGAKEILDGAQEAQHMSVLHWAELGRGVGWGWGLVHKGGGLGWL